MRIALWLLAPAMAGCAAVGGGGRLPSYDPASLTIPRSAREATAAVLEREGSCVLLRAAGRLEGARLVPIWPSGTSDRGERIVLPDRAPLPFGANLSVTGRFVAPAETAINSLAAGCPGRPFLVETANRSFAWTDAAGLVAMAHAALVVEVNAMAGDRPLGDGMAATIEVTVLEAIAGRGYQAGQRLSLRVPGSSGQPTAHRSLVDDLRKAAGQRLLLFVVQAFYAEQARVRGGSPLGDHVGGAFLYRLAGDRVLNGSDAATPATLTELRELAASNPGQSARAPRPCQATRSEDQVACR